MIEELIPISALQHYDYCPRQCALIHIERIWSENYWTAQGRVLHQRTDEGKVEQRVDTRVERSVAVINRRLGIQGKLDVLEVNLKDNTYTPVEYKRGKPKTTLCDKIQLCAQAMCLEEMRDTSIPRAAIWYWQVRHREWVELDDDLRAETERIIQAVHQLFREHQIPTPIYGSHCNACSLLDDCQPRAIQHDATDQYLRDLFKS